MAHSAIPNQGDDLRGVLDRIVTLPALAGRAVGGSVAWLLIAPVLAALFFGYRGAVLASGAMVILVIADLLGHFQLTGDCPTDQGIGDYFR